MPYCTSEIDEQSKQSVTSEKSTPNEVKTVSSAGKFIVTVFRDCKGIILFDFLKEDKTVKRAHLCIVIK